MMMGRSYKWRWDRQVVKGRRRGGKWQRRGVLVMKFFKCQWRCVKGRHKGVKKTKKKLKSIQKHWRAMRAVKSLTEALNGDGKVLKGYGKAPPHRSLTLSHHHLMLRGCPLTPSHASPFTAFPSPFTALPPPLNIFSSPFNASVAPFNASSSPSNSSTSLLKLFRRPLTPFRR